MRAKAVATISFGLVDIPVRVYAAVESKSKIEFRLLHAKCNSQLKQQHACPTCEKPVDRGDQVRGYEFAKGRFVTFDAAELEQVGELEDKPAKQAIAVEYFVDFSRVINMSSACVERCDFVGPDEGSERPFAAFVTAMNRQNSVAIAKFSTRGRTHLVALRPTHSGRLYMLQLRTLDEVRSISDVPMFQETEAADETVRLTELLIEQMMRGEISFGDHADEARQRLAEQIQQKIDAGDVVAAPSTARAKPIADLETALKASITKPAKKGAPASSG